ncbi:hypothetical protein V7094_15470 [Priestia megaterium]|uniref:DUF4376 domain-containing protein n=1 Tax=Priestia megaterium TaxID=1404 RepID=UPI002FFEF0EE
MYDQRVVVLIQVDENGFEVEPVIFNLYDEEGNPVTDIPNNLVPPNQNRLMTPKWDFEAKQWTEGDPEKALELDRNMAIDRLHAECTAYIENGFTYNGNFYAFSMVKDQANFIQQMSYLLLRPDIESVEWKTEDNGKVILSRDEFFAVCGAGEVWKRSNMSDYWDLEVYVGGLTTLEEIDNLGTFEEAVAKMKQAQSEQQPVEQPVEDPSTTDETAV